MVLFSADLNIIRDSFSKLTNKVLRDFMELESLQNSQRGTMRFTNMTVEFIKKSLYETLSERKRDWDIIFQDENENLENYDSNFRVLITPICGKINLSHAIPYFTISAAVQKKSPDGTFETLCGIIDSPATNEIFATEKNKGAFVNDRRIRVSSRNIIDESIVAIKNSTNKKFICENINKYKNVIVNNCDILNICRVSSGKYDIVILESKNPFLELPLLLFKESGGLVKETNDGFLLLSNEQLNSQL